MESLIPKRDYTIKMKCVKLSSFDVVFTLKVPHGMFLTDTTGTRHDLTIAYIREITDPQVKEFLPSRILPINKHDSSIPDVALVYYVNDMITTRPFTPEEKVYSFIIKAPNQSMMLNYDGLVKRMFVDQFVCNHDIYYFFIMSGEDFDQLFENKVNFNIIGEPWKDLNECLEKLANADKRDGE